MSKSPVKIGMVGTSWWADAMHLPALDGHPDAVVTAICGRRRDPAEKMATSWNIPAVYTDYNKMISEADIDAIVISTPNDSHYPISKLALEKGLHVLCEKPIALTYPEAQELADLACEKGVKHLVPFTYRFMPTARYLKRLIDDEAYIGKPYHLNMRYYTGYARDGKYHWRFDVGRAGSGIIGDIASHFLYLSEWFYGEIKTIYCQAGYIVPRDETDPQGNSYEVADDSAIITMEFENGAIGTIHATAVCYEDTPFGQTHHMEFHGSDGTLYNFIDWDTIQEVRGARVGEGMIKPLPIPADITENTRMDTVHNTYRDIFRQKDFMIRDFINAIANDTACSPTLDDGARVQRLLDACVESSKRGCRVTVADINP